jgi:hypothetical protein
VFGSQCPLARQPRVTEKVDCLLADEVQSCLRNFMDSGTRH